MNGMQERIELPTGQEVEQVMGIIREEFARAGVTLDSLTERPEGGIIAKALMTTGVRMKLVNALFGHGILMVSLGGDYGFAVRR